MRPHFFCHFLFLHLITSYSSVNDNDSKKKRSSPSIAVFYNKINEQRIEVKDLSLPVENSSIETRNRSVDNTR